MTTNLNAGVRFTLLSVPFVAAMQKDDKALQILLMPSTADKPKKITIGDIVSEIKNLIGNGSEAAELETGLTNALNGMKDEKASKFDPLKIGITVQQAFLYYRKEFDTTNPDKPDGPKIPAKPATFEYAFSLSVDMSEFMKDIKVFTIDEVFLSVWNTDRQGIINEMKMLKMEDYIKLCDHPIS